MAGHTDNHGHTPAAWTGVIIAIIGFGVGGAFTVLAEPWGVVGGLAIVLIGGVVGMVMRSMGLGQKPAAAPRPVPAPAAAKPAKDDEPVASDAEAGEPKAAVSG